MLCATLDGERVMRSFPESATAMDDSRPNPPRSRRLPIPKVADIPRPRAAPPVAPPVQSPMPAPSIAKADATVRHDRAEAVASRSLSPPKDDSLVPESRCLSTRRPAKSSKAFRRVVWAVAAIATSALLTITLFRAWWLRNAEPQMSSANRDVGSDANGSRNSSVSAQANRRPTVTPAHTDRVAPIAAPPTTTGHTSRQRTTKASSDASLPKQNAHSPPQATSETPATPKPSLTPAMPSPATPPPSSDKEAEQESKPPEEPTWVGKDGFPYRVAMALAAVDQQRHAKDPNELRGKLELKDREAKLRDVVGDARKTLKRQRTKLFVIDANERAVRVLADASWGWPTGDLFMQAAGLEERAPKSGLVWLATEGGCRDVMTLPVGSAIPAAVATTLRWGDRILVEFDIRDVAWRSAKQLRSDRPAPVTPLDEIVVVSTANLRCVDHDPRPAASSIWPAPGTFPEVISRRPDDYRFMFPFIRLTVKEAKATFKVKRVTEKQVEFDNFLAPNTASVPVFAALESLTEGIELPVSTIGTARAARLEENQPVTLTFKVKDIVPRHVLDPASYRTGFGYTSQKLAYAVIVADLRWAEPRGE